MNATEIKVSGNVVSDPILRQTKYGDAFLTFRIAVTAQKRSPDGAWIDGDSQFFSVTAFKTLAGNAYHSMAKGQRVVVHGRLRIANYTGQDGKPRTSVQIEAHEIGASWMFGQTAFTACRHPVLPTHDRLADEVIESACREVEGLTNDTAGEAGNGAASSAVGARTDEQVNAPTSATVTELNQKAANHGDIPDSRPSTPPDEDVEIQLVAS